MCIVSGHEIIASFVLVNKQASSVNCLKATTPNLRGKSLLVTAQVDRFTVEPADKTGGYPSRYLHMRACKGLRPHMDKWKTTNTSSFHLENWFLSLASQWSDLGRHIYKMLPKPLQFHVLPAMWPCAMPLTTIVYWNLPRDSRFGISAKKSHPSIKDGSGRRVNFLGKSDAMTQEPIFSQNTTGRSYGAVADWRELLILLPCGRHVSQSQ